MQKSLLMSFALLLTAYGAPSVEDLMKDQELLREITRECGLLMTQDKDYDTEECKNTILAQKNDG